MARRPSTRDRVPPAGGVVRAISYRAVVDLSHVIHPGIPRWPGDPPVALTPIADLAHDGWYVRSLTIGEHSGTHVNAPAGFHEGGAGIDEYDAERLVAPAVVIDVRQRVADDADHLVARADVESWEASHGPIPAGSIVILFTGWQELWDDPVAFLGDGGDGRHFPGLAPDAARWLLDHRAIAGIGIDTHGVDGGQDTQYRTNAAVLERDGIVLENLTNLHRLPATGTTIVIGILRLAAGSGSPAGVLAFVP